MTVKPEQAQAFYASLTGLDNPVMVWQTFCDYDKDRKELATWWAGHLDAARLADHQAMGCGVFTTINGGGRYAADINQFRAVFMDSDGIPLPAQWVVAPHIIVQRDPTHYHAYWLLDGDCEAAEWSIAQKQIALHYGSDDKIVNPDRVMRVPGFNHQKDLTNPQLYELVYNNPALPRYKLREIIGNFTLTGDNQQKLAQWINQRNGQWLNEAEDYDDCEANQIKYIEYLTQRAEHGIDGQGRNAIRFKTAAAGRDYGLSPEKTVDLMLEHWDHGNQPPCGPELIETSVRNAYRYNQNKLGSRSLSIFLDAPATPLLGMSHTPVESVRYVEESVQAPSAQAAVAAMLSAPAPTPGQQEVLDAPQGDGFYSKNHTQNALSYLTTRSPNGEYTIYEDEVYLYDGKVFRRQDGSFLNSRMASAMLHVAPSASDVEGSVKMAKHILRNESPKKWPEWKSDPDRDTSGVINFANGVLDMNTNEWFEHTPLLRSRNILPYNYDHTATCPEWLKFLDSVWGNSDLEPLIEQLQMWFGYILTDDTSQHKMAIISGESRSGKGTISRVMRNMLGKHNCVGATLDGLSTNSMLASIYDKMVAVFDDVADPSNSNRNAVVQKLKSIVGEGDVPFDRKYLPGISAVFRCRIFMTCNQYPDLAESSAAMMARFLFFHMPRSFVGMEDLTLGDRLDAELPGIINWALEGLRKLHKVVKLKNHPCMDDRIRLYRVVSSPLEMFMGAEIRKRADAYVPVIEVYRRYLQWSRENGGTGVRLNTFMRQLDVMEGIEVGLAGSEQVVRGAYLRPLDIEAP